MTCIESTEPLFVLIVAHLFSRSPLSENSMLSPIQIPLNAVVLRKLHTNGVFLSFRIKCIRPVMQYYVYGGRIEINVQICSKRQLRAIKVQLCLIQDENHLLNGRSNRRWNKMKLSHILDMDWTKWLFMRKCMPMPIWDIWWKRSNSMGLRNFINRMCPYPFFYGYLFMARTIENGLRIILSVLLWLFFLSGKKLTIRMNEQQRAIVSVGWVSGINFK